MNELRSCRLKLKQVLVPLADATLVKAPEGIMDKALILMADIFPTGKLAV